MTTPTFGPVTIPMKRGSLSVSLPPGHDLDYDGLHTFWSDMCCCQENHLLCIHWLRDKLENTEAAE